MLARPPLLRLAPQTGVRQKADLPEHAERCGRKMKSLGVKYNSRAMVEYKSWGGKKKKKGGWCGVKSHHCCYGNQILPITGSRRAKILGSLDAAHIASQTPPPLLLPISPKTLTVLEALSIEAKDYEAATAFNQPSWQNIFRSSSEKCQTLSSYYLLLQECTGFCASP